MFSEFSLKVFSSIYDSYPSTYFVGGAVRNFLLGKRFSDIDISTSATPQQVINILQKNGIKFSDAYKNMGVVIVKKDRSKIEITSFRQEHYTKSRFPSVKFITSAKIDSRRRDFTINALYFNPITKEILDFHDGIADLLQCKLKFIGNPVKKIAEDPLRIIRAYRFQLQYKLQIDLETERALNRNKVLLNSVNSERINKEINAVKNKNLRNKLKKVIHSNT